MTHAASLTLRERAEIADEAEQDRYWAGLAHEPPVLCHECNEPVRDAPITDAADLVWLPAHKRRQWCHPDCLDATHDREIAS